MVVFFRVLLDAFVTGIRARHPEVCVRYLRYDTAPRTVRGTKFFSAVISSTLTERTTLTLRTPHQNTESVEP